MSLPRMGGVEPPATGTQNAQAGTIPQAHTSHGQRFNLFRVEPLAFCFQVDGTTIRL